MICRLQRITKLQVFFSDIWSAPHKPLAFIGRSDGYVVVGSRCIRFACRCCLFMRVRCHYDSCYSTGCERMIKLLFQCQSIFRDLCADVQRFGCCRELCLGHLEVPLLECVRIDYGFPQLSRTGWGKVIVMIKDQLDSRLSKKHAEQLTAANWTIRIGSCCSIPCLG